MKDVVEEPGQNIVIDKPGITLDLKGHEIGSPSTVTITDEASDTKIVSSGSADPESEDTGKISAKIKNDGGLTLGEGVKAAEVSREGAGVLS